jgi:5-methylthioadenosine/S-adenosylhomocysteine deaminase
MNKTRMSLLILLCFGACRPPAPAGESTADLVDIVIRGGTVVTMDSDRRVLEGGSVVVRGERIEAVLAAGEAVPSARETVDATGQLVIPGLVNSHGHVAMTLLRGVADDLKLMEWLEGYIFPAEGKNVSPEFVYWGTLLGCIEMARSGTTTFTDQYYFEEEVARATDEAGLRGVLGQTIIGFPVPDYKTPEEALAGTEGFILRYRDHPRVIPSVAPHALYTTSIEVVERAYELARRYAVPFQIHAVEPPTENEQVLKLLGKETIAALDDAGILAPGTILHHSIWLSDSDIERIARSGAGVSHNPESNMKTASGVARVPELLAAGVPVGLGTDGPASNNNLDLFEEMDTAAKLHKVVTLDPTVMPAETVFQMATLGGARALGLEGSIGSIEPGKLADIVMIDARVPELTPLYDVYSHLVYVVKGGDVGSVLVGGRFVVRNRDVTTVDVDEVMARARELQVQILKSLEEVEVERE